MIRITPNDEPEVRCQCHLPTWMEITSRILGINVKTSCYKGGLKKSLGCVRVTKDLMKKKKVLRLKQKRAG